MARGRASANFWNFSPELQYLFSVYGDYGVGDDVAIVWEKSGTEENPTYTVVDVVGDE